MPAPVHIADEEVIAAGRAIQAEGKKVTGWTLRAALGRGGPVKLLEVWEAFQAAEPKPEMAPGPVLPPEAVAMVDVAQEQISGLITELGLTLWQSAEALVTARLKGELDAANASALQAQADLEEAARVITGVESERDSALALAETLEPELVRLNAELAAMRGRAEAAEAANREAQLALQAAAEERGRLLQRAESAEAAAEKLAQQAPGSPTRSR